MHPNNEDDVINSGYVRSSIIHLDSLYLLPRPRFKPSGWLALPRNTLNNIMKGFVEPEIIVDVAAEETTALTADMKDTVDPLGSGFTWYTPPMARPGSSHETSNGRDWSIAGHDMQVLVMSLPVNETVVTYVARVLDHSSTAHRNRYLCPGLSRFSYFRREVGSFMFGSPDIQMDVELTCCKGGEGCRRICGGESCVKLLILNGGSQSGVRIVPALPLSAIALCFSGLQMVSHTPFVVPQVSRIDTQLPRQSYPCPVWQTPRRESHTHCAGRIIHDASRRR
jgi:hypothetical protein